MNLYLAKLILIFVALFAATLAVQVAHAQTPPISATVDRSSLPVDETFTLTISTTGEGELQPPVLPTLDGMILLDTSSSSEINFVGSQAITEAVHVYTIRPTQTGNLTIGAVTVTIAGQTHSTNPILLSIVPGAGGSTGPSAGTPAGQIPDRLTGQDFYADAIVDNGRPHVGEQVIYTFRLFRAVEPPAQPTYNPPPFTGFWNRQVPDTREFDIQAAGRRYRVFEQNTILFPSFVGQIDIAPSTLTVPMPDSQPPLSLRTESVTLGVLALPASAPAGFGGAVGNISISSEIDATSGRANEPLTLTVIIQGAANIDLLPDPVWPRLEGWKEFTGSPTIESRIVDSQIVGTRSYERLLVPGVLGEFVVPPLLYTYFDPADDQFRTVATNPIPVSITRSGVSSGSNVLPTLRPIKPAVSIIDSAGDPITSKAYFWLVWIVSPVLVIVTLAAKWALGRRQRDTSATRYRVAKKAAQKSIKQARKEGLEPKNASLQVLTRYINDKTNDFVSGMTYHRLESVLRSRGVSGVTSEQVLGYYVESDRSRFALITGLPQTPEVLFGQVDALIGNLEKEFE